MPNPMNNQTETIAHIVHIIDTIPCDTEFHSQLRKALQDAIGWDYAKIEKSFESLNESEKYERITGA